MELIQSDNETLGLENIVPPCSIYYAARVGENKWSHSFSILENCMVALTLMQRFGCQFTSFFK